MNVEDYELSQSLEDYLEAILILERKYKVARVKQIADMLDVRMPSVTNAVKLLREKELVNYQKNSYISLTETGKKIATKVSNRHVTIKTFLEQVLRFSQKDAEQTACKIEHVIDGDFIQRLKLLNQFFDQNINSTDRFDQWLTYINQNQQGNTREMKL